MIEKRRESNSGTMRVENNRPINSPAIVSPTQ